MVRMLRHAVGQRWPDVIKATASHFDPPGERDGVQLLDHEIGRDTPDVPLQQLLRLVEGAPIEMGHGQMPGIVAVDDAAGPHPKRQQGFEPANTRISFSAAQINMREAMMSPWDADIALESLLRETFRSVGIAAKLVSKAVHGEEVRIAGVRRGEALHMPQKPWTFLLLAKNIVNELRDFRR